MKYKLVVLGITEVDARDDEEAQNKALMDYDFQLIKDVRAKVIDCEVG